MARRPEISGFDKEAEAFFSSKPGSHTPEGKAEQAAKAWDKEQRAKPGVKPPEKKLPGLPLDELERDLDQAA